MDRHLVLEREVGAVVLAPRGSVVEVQEGRQEAHLLSDWALDTVDGHLALIWEVGAVVLAPRGIAVEVQEGRQEAHLLPDSAMAQWTSCPGTEIGAVVLAPGEVP